MSNAEDIIQSVSYALGKCSTIPNHEDNDDSYNNKLSTFLYQLPRRFGGISIMPWPTRSHTILRWISFPIITAESEGKEQKNEENNVVAGKVNAWPPISMHSYLQQLGLISHCIGL